MKQNKIFFLILMNRLLGPFSYDICKVFSDQCFDNPNDLKPNTYKYICSGNQVLVWTLGMHFEYTIGQIAERNSQGQSFLLKKAKRQ